MLTRRTFQFAAVSLASEIAMSGVAAWADDLVNVQIRADETVRAVLPAIEQTALTVRPDNSTEAKYLASRTPSGRALPILVIIAGAIAFTELLEMIKELYRQTYYGGVLIDTRARPPMITSDPKIPASMVFVIDGEGKTSQYTGDKFSLDALKLALSTK